MPDIEPAGPDRAQLRISDADRHHVAEVLREAAGDGRIELSELDERLEATFSAKTYADLVPITSDLPVPKPANAPAAATAATAANSRHIAIMSGFERKGVWQVPEQLTVLAFMGGADIDMRRATFAAREVTVTVNAIMGGAHIVVGPGTHVVMDGVGIMGGYAGPGDHPDDTDFTADSPTVRVRGVAIMGGVHVERKEL
ncbi:MAG TPA: DUF1707 domain-containing protein [Marmoricola sp.]